MESAREKFWIAIVDDDAMVRKAVGRLLRSAGFSTQSFASAEDFLHYESGLSAGCLVLDIGLPGMSGLELQQHLSKAGSPVPIIFMTARPDPEGHMQATAISSGALAFLSKPLDRSNLLIAVQAAYAQHTNKRGP